MATTLANADRRSCVGFRLLFFCVIDSDETNRLKKAPNTIDATTMISSARLLTVPHNIPKPAKNPAIPAVAIPMVNALIG